MPKKIFVVDDKEVHAAGCLFYKRSPTCIQLLIQENNKKYEDIGGRIEKADADIYDTVNREIEEETNGLITNTKDRLKKASYVYIPNAKYIIFIMEATKEEAKYTKESFGTIETHTNINRAMGWIYLIELLAPLIVKYKLSWRMRNKILFHKLHEINNMQRNKIKMFHLPTKQNNLQTTSV